MKTWKRIILPSAVALGIGLAAAWAAQTNYLGTVFIADPTTPTRQLQVNSDGSINAVVVSSTAGLTPLASVPKSAGYTTVAGDVGKSIDVTTGSSDVTITLVAPATAGAGALQQVTKVDAGTGKVIVSNGTALAWLSTLADTVWMRSNGSAWVAYQWTIAPRLDSYTVAGPFTWTKPPLAKTVAAVVIGSGGGGGSGSQFATGNISGGGGGGPGGISFLNPVLASALGSTVAVVVGAGGTGGAAVSAGTLPGNDGGSSNASSFGYVQAVPNLTPTGGNGGASGTTAAGGFASLGRAFTNTGGSSTVAAAGSNGAVTSTTLGVYACGGGAGQNATTPANFNGGNAGSSDTLVGSIPPLFSDVPGVGGIASTKTAPTTGTGAIYEYGIQLGAPGGGGWAASDGTASNGSAGSQPGGCGGGGGASTNGNNSGAGGNGGDGGVYAITRFNFLLKRDLAPAANDNSPMWLNAAA